MYKNKGYWRTEWASGPGATLGLAAESKERDYSALLAWGRGKVKTRKKRKLLSTNSRSSGQARLSTPSIRPSICCCQVHRMVLWAPVGWGGFSVYSTDCKCLNK